MIHNTNYYCLREVRRYFNDACRNFGLENDITIQLGYLVEYTEKGLIPTEWALQEAFRLYNEELDKNIEEVFIEYAQTQIEFNKFITKGFLPL